MNLRKIFTISGILLLLFGSGFVLLPEFVFSMYGVALDENGIMLAQVAGAAVVALGILALLSRQQQGTPANRTAVITLFSFFVIKTVVTILAQFNGIFNALGWSIVALDGFFVLALGSVLLGQGRIPFAHTQE